ncbi:MAG: tetratricopeptide repeat protein, partial [Anaerolineae bacterium]|nr:tetratricopeptide repeat protein [Anaerolineae bacterium]
TLPRPRARSEVAQHFHERSCALHEARGNSVGLASSLNNLAVVKAMQQQFEAALQDFERSRALREQLGDRHGMAMSYNNLGFVAYLNSQFATAEDYYQKSLAIREAIGDQSGAATTLVNIGSLQVELSEAEAALSLLRGLNLAQRLGMVPVMLEALVYYARLMLRQNQPERAATLIGLVASHPTTNQELRQQIQPITEELAASLSPERLKACLETGQATPLDDILRTLP